MFKYFLKLILSFLYNEYKMAFKRVKMQLYRKNELDIMSKNVLSLNLCNCFPTAQPAGIPEILKKSLHSCSVRGGEEVFIIGKNFLKDTKVIFHENVAGEANFCHLPENVHMIFFLL